MQIMVLIPFEMDWMSKVLIIQAAMPAGDFAVVVVGNYSGDRDTAMRSIIVTMVLSLVTLPSCWIFYIENIVENRKLLLRCIVGC